MNNFIMFASFNMILLLYCLGLCKNSYSLVVASLWKNSGNVVM